MSHFARSAALAAEVSAEASAHWKATAASRSANPCESSCKRALWQSASTFRTAAADPLSMKSSALIIDNVPPLPSRPDSSGRPSGPSYRLWIPPRRAPERPSVTGKRLLSAAFSPVQIIRRHSANVLSEGDTFTKDSTRFTSAQWFAHRASAAALAFA